MEEFAEYNAMPKYVVSTTLVGDPVDSGTTRRCCVRLDEVARLKQGDGGNDPRARQRHARPGAGEAGLVDRYHLLVFPVVLGEGKRLFSGRETGKLSLVEHEAYSNGVVKNVFDVVR